MSKSLRWLLPLSLTVLLAAPLAAQPPGHPQGPPPTAPGAVPAVKPPEEKKPPLEEKVSKTQHTLTLDGQTIAYTANAGTLILKDEDGTQKASVFYVAYTKDGIKDPATRPVTFCFNGGPGSASLWVHLGAFGPKRVERDADGMGLKPPGRLIDNDQSILDLTDLVFIDPVSTGYSRPAPGQDAKQFHGVRQDIESVAQFIRLWVTRNERWASPKLVAGESYGTTRAAGLAAYLSQRYGMELNGVILISSVLNWQNQEFHVGNDMPFIIHVPTYTAAAWYHKKLPPELMKDLRATLKEAEDFARNDYAQALMQGDRLAPEKRHDIAARLARYTGLSQQYVERSNLRIEIDRFTKELLRDQGKTIGRLDTRFTGVDLDSVGEDTEYDPASVSLDGPYAAMVNDYIRRDLGFKDDLPYERSARVYPWSFEGFENQYVNMAENLRRAITHNPHLQVLVTASFYDLATPYFDAVYTIDHLGLPESLRGNVRIATYEAGHMMYIRRSEHEKLKKDIAGLLRSATAP
ncbi:MAG TPA: peptidase S10 [Thermoanaerobaculia bacterium]|jgi:carboxypeptidase C (cathepsin A)|nr:peptidase S10 [Thermoanaerobaculia bacterium]